MIAQPLRWHMVQRAAPGVATAAPTDLQRSVIGATAALRSNPVAALVSVLGDARAALAWRIAAGNLLALAGDPRIDPFAPDMIAIAGGTVSIGLEPDRIDPVVRRLAHMGIVDSWIAREVPCQQVWLKPFRLARYLVTNAEYAAFLDDHDDAEVPTSWTMGRYPAERANHPVHTVSAIAAEAYARWVSRRTGRTFRLPTEPEWEHAAAGPQALEYPWGALFDPALCNTAECGLRNTSPVGAFVGGESPFGLSDMGGNVAEFVATVIGDHVPAPIDARYRVVRGGGFACPGDLSRTCRRHAYNPRAAHRATGFRLAESPA